mmetsp:Transcript_34816/g.98714  ORF Transcript_34816/g.98714 Transcript_34816/m.98714 type:complete len:435 (+) Transcript_34816:281-1585(+)
MQSAWRDLPGSGGAATLFHRNRGRLLALGLAGAAAYAYQSGTFDKAKQTCKRVYGLLQLYYEAAQTGGEVASSVMNDLQAFMASDSDELPQSLKQLAKLFSSTNAAACYETAVKGSLRGAMAAGGGTPVEKSTADKFLELLFSERGHSLVSVAIRMAVDRSVKAVSEVVEEQASRQIDAEDSTEPKPDRVTQATQAVLTLITDPGGKEALSSFISNCVSTAVGTYVEKTIDHNFYQDMMASVATPSNREAVEKISAHVTREAVDAFITLSSASRSRAGGSALHGKDLLEVSRALVYDDDGNPCTETPAVGNATSLRPAAPNTQARSMPDYSTVQQILQAVASSDGRQLVSEVAGSVTSEAVRSTIFSLLEAVGLRSKPHLNGTSKPLQESDHRELLVVDNVFDWGTDEKLYVGLVASMGCWLLFLLMQYSMYAS